VAAAGTAEAVAGMAAVAAADTEEAEEGRTQGEAVGGEYRAEASRRWRGSSQLGTAFAGTCWDYMQVVSPP